MSIDVEHRVLVHGYSERVSASIDVIGYLENARKRVSGVKGSAGSWITRKYLGLNEFLDLAMVRIGDCRITGKCVQH